MDITELLKHDHTQMADGVIAIKGADLRREDFNGVVLENYIFQRCLFTQSTFLAAKLRNVQFTSCSMQMCNFSNALLDNVNFWQTYVADSIFDHATLVDMHGQYVDFSRVDFLTATINNAFIWMGNFNGAKANPEAGFRTRRGGDGPRYQVPVVCNNPEACEQCNQGCK